MADTTQPENQIRTASSAPTSSGNGVHVTVDTKDHQFNGVATNNGGFNGAAPSSIKAPTQTSGIAHACRKDVLQMLM